MQVHDTLLLSILSGLIVAVIVWAITVVHAYWQLHRMNGYWLEAEVLADGSRCYSLGHLHFSFLTKQHRYDGFKYKSDGTQEKKWNSLKIYLDAEHMKLMYIYELTNLSDKRSSHGFGQIDIPSHKALVGRGDTNGFYVDGEVTTMEVHHVQLFRTPEVAKERGLSPPEDNEKLRSLFIQRLVTENWSPNSPPIGGWPTSPAP